MVLITDDWEAFKEHAAYCRIGTYQEREVVNGVELRMRAGRFGIKRVFDPEDTRSEAQKGIYAEMMRFLKIQGFVKVIENIPDEFFHA